jgi:hypothetical protein
LAPPEVEDLMKSSVTAHFRIWQDVYDKLRGAARTREITLNMLVNQVLSAYTRDELALERIGIVKMPKSSFRVILSIMSDDQLAEWGRTMVTESADSVMAARKHNITIDSVLDNLRLSSRAGWFSIDEEGRSGKKAICMVHDFGPRGSVLLVATVMSLFGLVGVHPKVTTTNSTVTVEY